MELEKIVEALLFVSGEPMTIKELVRLSGAKKQEVEAALESLHASLSGRGIRLLRNDEEITLATAPETSSVAERIAKERLEGDLSKAALETLAIVLWKGKVSRASIDYIRGVNSAFSLRALLVRGLVRRETDQKDARIFLYSPTMDFLKYLGFGSVKELPQFEEMQAEMKEYE